MQARQASARRRRLLPYLFLGLLAISPLIVLALIRVPVALASDLLEKRYPPPGQMISVGDHRLHLYCAGTGGPTVIIEPGMGQDWVGWRLVISQLVSSRRVCVYDRAGYGWSEAGPWPRTALGEAGELHDLLDKAAIPGPYVIAAHSFGGYIARIYASRYRNSLTGVVLVDPSHEDERPDQAPETTGRMRLPEISSLIPPLGTDRLKRLYRGEQAIPPQLRQEPVAFQNRYLIASSLLQLKSERNEYDSLALSEAQVRAAPFPPDLPLTVITAMRSPSPQKQATHKELQQQLAHSSARGTQVLAENSWHMVPLEQPALIVDAIDRIAAASRQ
jgi:pimeloyl-ACP methyl ester carboxylesterase